MECVFFCGCSLTWDVAVFSLSHDISWPSSFPNNPSVSFTVHVYDNWTLQFLSITLHLKISCPSSPAVPMTRGLACPVPQVKIEMESDYDSDIDPHRPRDVSSETTLWRSETSYCLADRIAHNAMWPWLLNADSAHQGTEQGGTDWQPCVDWHQTDSGTNAVKAMKQ